MSAPKTTSKCDYWPHSWTKTDHTPIQQMIFIKHNTINHCLNFYMEMTVDSHNVRNLRCLDCPFFKIGRTACTIVSLGQHLGRLLTARIVYINSLIKLLFAFLNIKECILYRSSEVETRNGQRFTRNVTIIAKIKSIVCIQLRPQPFILIIIYTCGLVMVGNKNIILLWCVGIVFHRWFFVIYGKYDKNRAFKSWSASAL